MLIKEYRTHFINVLTPIYDSLEAESFFYLILETKCQMKRIDLALQPELVFTASDLLYWDSIVEQLLLEIPIQYLLGTTSFFGLDFEVNADVLIPRPETEELVAWILQNHSGNPQSVSILDIGTGSGCIAIALAKNLSNAKVAALDVSKLALQTANRNADRNVASVTFIQKNILEVQHLDETFDIIVSNPPYVRNLEKAEIKKNVLEHEPHLALFVDDNDALLFYRKIAILAQESLNKNGELYFEINQYLGKEMVALLEELGYKDIVLRKDIYGNDRMLYGSI
jgi:release factor glutamine methyltransferase